MDLKIKIPGILVFLLWCLSTPCLATEDNSNDIEHFVKGEFRGGLSWDSISAMETGVLKFGGTAGLFISNGIEVGIEQQFIVPPNSSSQKRSWGYIRYVPFRSWPIVPFLSARAGFYVLPEQDMAAVGAGVGAVMFIDSHFAFEATLFTQSVMNSRGTSEQQTEFDWRLVLYY